MTDSTKCEKCSESWGPLQTFKVNEVVRQLHDECAENLRRDHSVETIDDVVAEQDADILLGAAATAFHAARFSPLSGGVLPRLQKKLVFMSVVMAHRPDVMRVLYEAMEEIDNLINAADLYKANGARQRIEKQASILDRFAREAIANMS